MKYAVIIEKAGEGYSAYAPDLPGCISAGETLEQVERNIREAMQYHIEGLRQDGVEVPAPSTICEYIEA